MTQDTTSFEQSIKENNLELFTQLLPSLDYQKSPIQPLCLIVQLRHIHFLQLLLDFLKEHPEQQGIFLENDANNAILKATRDGNAQSLTLLLQYKEVTKSNGIFSLVMMAALGNQKEVNCLMDCGINAELLFTTEGWGQSWSQDPLFEARLKTMIETYRLQQVVPKSFNESPPTHRTRF